MVTKIIAGKPTESDDIYIYPDVNEEGTFRLFAVRGTSKQILMNIVLETLTMHFIPNSIIHFRGDDE